MVQFVQDNEGLTQTQLAEKAGYVRTTESGKYQIMTKQFCDALLVARGISITKPKRRGKIACYKTTVHKNGIILLGKSYSSRWGVEPGDELEILLEDDGIRLVPTGNRISKED